MNLQTLNIKSRGFELYMQFQAKNGRRTIDEIATDLGIAVTTVRKFIASDIPNLRQAEIGAAWVIARYLGATLDGPEDGMLYEGPAVDADTPKPVKVAGRRGRPRKEPTE